MYNGEKHCAELLAYVPAKPINPTLYPCTVLVIYRPPQARGSLEISPFSVTLVTLDKTQGKCTLRDSSTSLVSPKSKSEHVSLLANNHVMNIPDHGSRNRLHRR